MSGLSIPSNPSRFIYHFLGLAPVATSIVTPMVVHYQLRNKPVSAHERKLLVMQEVARQITSAATGLVTYYGGGWLTGKLLKGSPQKSVLQIVAGTLAQFVGYGLIRPMISTELILKWLSQDVPRVRGNSTAVKPLEAEQRMQQFLHAVQVRSAGNLPAGAEHQFRGQTARRLNRRA